MMNGKKNTSEKLFLKSLKTLQITSLKQPKQLLQLCVINLILTFKLHKSTNKKIRKKRRKIRITPVYIGKPLQRISFGIKLFLKQLRKRKSNEYFYKKLTNELLLLADNRGIGAELQSETRKNVIKNKRYLKNYKW